MENLFHDIEDKRQLDQLLRELRAAFRSTIEARDTAKEIITRKIKQPEWIRTVNRKMFPQLQQTLIEFRELIADAKEQRINVQRHEAKHSDSGVD